MIEKVSIGDLRVGMYVVDSGLSWLDHPFLYSTEGMVESQRQIDRIRRDGYLEFFIDPERSTHAGAAEPGRGTVEEQLSRLMDASSGAAPLKRPKNRVPLRQEMGVARKLYSETLAYARKFMQGVSGGGQADIEQSEEFVENIIDSVSRNMDALISLSKLRVMDEYTYTHCINVAVLSVAFGRFLGLSTDDLRGLGMAGLFHDLGKAKSPPKVLNKPGKLTPEEFAVIQRHPADGHALLLERGGLGDAVLRGVVEHHEKYSGEGYPKGLGGDGICAYARIITVADVYDALTSKRVYKKGMPGGKAMSVLYSMRGQDFFPNYVEHFIKCIGVYPVGALVRLSTGYLAVVSEANPDNMLRPILSLAISPTGAMIAPERLSLAEPEGEGVKIDAVLDPAEYKIDPARYL